MTCVCWDCGSGTNHNLKKISPETQITVQCCFHQLWCMLGRILMYSIPKVTGTSPIKSLNPHWMNKPMDLEGLCSQMCAPPLCMLLTLWLHGLLSWSYCKGNPANPLGIALHTPPENLENSAQSSIGTINMCIYKVGEQKKYCQQDVWGKYEYVLASNLFIATKWKAKFHWLEETLMK